MKILNDIACNLNQIKFKFLSSIQIQLEKNRMQIGAKDTEIFTCDYGVENNTFENTLIQKDTFSFLFT